MELYRLRAFPNGEGGGNKAGVVLDADFLTDAQMQDIASEVGYSETAFVTKSTRADVAVRFFTPTTEVDLCGHATIATFNLLRQKKRLQKGVYTQETKAGILKLDVRDEIVYMEQKHPHFSDLLHASDVAKCFLEKDFVDTRYPIQIVSTGMKEIFLPVINTDVLHQLQPDFEEIMRVSKQFGVIGIHAFALDDTVDAYGRNFAPLVGIDEESATGTSNGALSCYLYRYVTKKNQYVLRQGYSMKQPSEIYGTIETIEDEIQAVYVGGRATLITK
jgi:PhzF family phenazine biosynthesis protein